MFKFIKNRLSLFLFSVQRRHHDPIPSGEGVMVFFNYHYWDSFLFVRENLPRLRQSLVVRRNLSPKLAV